MHQCLGEIGDFALYYTVNLEVTFLSYLQNNFCKDNSFSSKLPSRLSHYLGLVFGNANYLGFISFSHHIKILVIKEYHKQQGFCECKKACIPNKLENLLMYYIIQTDQQKNHCYISIGVEMAFDKIQQTFTIFSKKFLRPNYEREKV